MKWRQSKEELFVDWLSAEITHNGHKNAITGTRNIRFPLYKVPSKTIWRYKDHVFRIIENYFSKIPNMQSEIFFKAYKLKGGVNEQGEKTDALSFTVPVHKRLEKYEVPNWLGVYWDKKGILARVLVHENLLWTEGFHSVATTGLHKPYKGQTIDGMLFVPGRYKESKEKAINLYDYLQKRILKTGFGNISPRVIIDDRL